MDRPRSNQGIDAAGGPAIIMRSPAARRGRREPKVLSRAEAPMEWRTEASHAAFVAHREPISPQEPAQRGCAPSACLLGRSRGRGQKLHLVPAGKLKFGPVIRFRGNIKGPPPLLDPADARVLPGALAAAGRDQRETVRCLWEREMKQAWCLAVSAATSRALLRLHGKRWGIECGRATARIRACAWAWDRSPPARPGARPLRLPDRAAFDSTLLSALEPGEPAIGVMRKTSHN